MDSFNGTEHGDQVPRSCTVGSWDARSLQVLLCLSQEQQLLVSVRDKDNSRYGPWA